MTIRAATVRQRVGRCDRSTHSLTVAALSEANVKPTDICIEDVTHSFEDFLYRTPIKFGGVALDRCTLINVEIRVRTRNGQVAKGFGSMPLGNAWSFPSRVLSYEATF